MTVTARMRVHAIEDNGYGGKQLTMWAVYSADKDSPNYSYSQATPNARLEMTITNPGAFNQFEPGKEYDLTFTPTAP